MASCASTKWRAESFPGFKDTQGFAQENCGPFKVMQHVHHHHIVKRPVPEGQGLSVADGIEPGREENIRGHYMGGEFLEVHVSSANFQDRARPAGIGHAAVELAIEFSQDRLMMPDQSVVVQP